MPERKCTTVSRVENVGHENMEEYCKKMKNAENSAMESQTNRLWCYQYKFVKTVKNINQGDPKKLYISPHHIFGNIQGKK